MPISPPFNNSIAEMLVDKKFLVYSTRVAFPEESEEIA